MARRVAWIVVVAACGGKQPAPATAGSGSGSNAAAEKQAEKATMPPAVAKFRDALGTKDSCDTVPELHADADAIGKATPPTTANADVWTTATKRLVDAVAGLDAPCAAHDTAQVEVAFGKVHDSFQFLLDAAGGHVK